jgi:hypothetical protein
MLLKNVSPISLQNNKATSQAQTGMNAVQSSWAWWGQNANF